MSDGCYICRPGDPDAAEEGWGRCDQAAFDWAWRRTYGQSAWSMATLGGHYRPATVQYQTRPGDTTDE